ncbi:MAG: hypothetical protein ACK5PF_05170, partial [bacterium]
MNGLQYWAPSAATALGIVATFIAGSVAFQRFGASGEIARKAVHVACGLAAAIAPLLFARDQILAGVLLLGVGLPVGARLGLFQGVVTAQRSMAGPYYFLLAFAILVLIEGRPMFLATPLLVLAIADTAASLAGRTWGRRVIRNTGGRTWIGTVAFLISAFLTTAVSLMVVGGQGPGLALCTALGVALATTAAEAIAPSALDNLAVPIVAYLVLRLAEIWPTGSLENLVLLAQLAGALAISVVARRARWLTDLGALSVLGLAVLIVAARGLPLALTLL